jgi:hypothetical protein
VVEAPEGVLAVGIALLVVVLEEPLSSPYSGVRDTELSRVLVLLGPAATTRSKP